MRRNVGSIDRTARRVLAIVGLLMALTRLVTSVPESVVRALALTALMTILTGTCSMYAVLGMSTRKGPP